jgi:acyl-CoA thioester hydrolase
MQEPPVPGMVGTTALTVHKRRVTWADVDPSGAWHFTAALTYVEEAEIELLRGAGVLDIINSHLPRIYVRADFKRPAYFDDEVTVQLAVGRLGVSSVHYQFALTANDAPLAVGSMGAAFTNGLGVPQPLPDAVRAALSRREL